MNERELLAEYERAREAGDREGILAAHASLQDIYAPGAKDCPRCGKKPHGMHPGPGRFLVGCLGCTTKADRVESLGETPEEAVERWNADEYVPPKSYAIPAASTPEG